MSAERFERVNQLVHTIFGPTFHVVASEHNKRYHINHHQADKDLCLNFYFDDELFRLHIAWLSKCGSADDLRSGKLLLNMVDALAGSIPECKTITLHDESTVFRCYHPINLAELAILLTGMSWYNRFGYKQQSYESDKKHNRGIINMSISDAEELLSDSHYGKFVEYKAQLDATTFKLANSSDLTVAEYVKFLYERIKPYPEGKCDKPIEHTAELATYVIKAFGSLLTYNDHGTALTKQVVHGEYVPPFINPSTMTAFEFEPETVFICGQCGMVLRGDDLPPWNAPPRGVKYYTTRGEGEHEELICHKCAKPGGGARKSRRTRRKPMRRTRRRTRMQANDLI